MTPKPESPNTLCLRRPGGEIIMLRDGGETDAFVPGEMIEARMGEWHGWFQITECVGVTDSLSMNDWLAIACPGYGTHRSTFTSGAGQEPPSIHWTLKPKGGVASGPHRGMVKIVEPRTSGKAVVVRSLSELVAACAQSGRTIVLEKGNYSHGSTSSLKLTGNDNLIDLGDSFIQYDGPAVNGGVAELFEIEGSRIRVTNGRFNSAHGFNRSHRVFRVHGNDVDLFRNKIEGAFGWFAVNETETSEGFSVRENVMLGKVPLGAYAVMVVGVKRILIHGNQIDNAAWESAVRLIPRHTSKGIVYPTDVEITDNVINCDDAKDSGVSGDMLKAAVTCQASRRVYIAGNRVRDGAIGWGPLDGGQATASESAIDCVMEDNIQTSDRPEDAHNASLIVNAGSSKAILKNNRTPRILIRHRDQFGRVVDDVQIIGASMAREIAIGAGATNIRTDGRVAA